MWTGWEAGAPLPCPPHLPGKVASPLLQAPTCLGPGQRAVLRQGLALGLAFSRGHFSAMGCLFLDLEQCPCLLHPGSQEQSPRETTKMSLDLAQRPLRMEDGGRNPQSESQG